MFADCIKDLRYGARMLGRSKGFFAVAVVSLSLGIGANSAIFSVLHSITWSKLPVSRPEQLVLIRRSTGPRLISLSYPLYLDVAERSDVFNSICASGELFAGQVRIAGGDSIGKISARLVTTNYFSTLGVIPSAGRLLQPGETDAVSVISWDFWNRQWGRENSAIGAALTVNKVSTTIIGVTPPGFFGDTPGLAPDIFLPMELQPQLMPGLNWLTNGRSYWLTVLGRLQPGVNRQAAEAALRTTQQQYLLKQGRKQYADGRERLAVLSGARGVTSLEEQFGQPLFILMGIAALLLLIACGNLANLLLARASAREKEIGIRVALGAGRGRMVRQVVAECLLLSFVGSLFALAIAAYGRRALIVMASDPTSPIRIDYGLNWRIFFFTMVFAILTTFLFGLVPALKTSQVRVNEVLKVTCAGTGFGPERRRLGKLLIGVQAALSVIMVAGTGLMLRTVANLRSVDAGFSPARVLLVRFAFEPSMEGFEHLSRIAVPLGERLRGLPGIEAAGFSTFGGLSNSYQTTSVSLMAGSAEPYQDIRMNLVSPGYFEAYGIELLQGRSFRDSDTADSQKSVIVNLAAARRLFPGENPLGKRVCLDAQYDPSRSLEIIGVARDAKWRNLREAMLPTVYVSLNQVKNPALFLAIRTRGDSTSLAGTLRALVRETDPQLGIERITTLEDDVAGSMRTELMLAKLTGAFGLLALILVSTGIYGIISYSVSRRTREFGIRMALGADPWRIRSMILREVAVIACTGLLAGSKPRMVWCPGSRAPRSFRIYSRLCGRFVKASGKVLSFVLRSAV
jgi:predicted permease